MNLEKILIVGAGNGGQAAAVDLTRRGFKVCLYEFPYFASKLGDKITTKRISSTGFIEGNTDIDLITTEEQEAAKYSKTVLVTMPAFGHSRFFAEFNDILQENSNVYLFPGNLSTLATSKNVELIKRGITFVELNSLPYGCRITEEGVVKISIRTKLLTYSAFPAKETDKVAAEIERLYPQTRKDTDILAVSLNNPNPLIHPPGVLLNLGRIEHSGGDFYMYNEGMTNAILRLIKGVDQERIKLGTELDYNLIPFEDFGGILPDGSEKSFIACGESARMRGPCNSNNRYLTEDVPFGLANWSKIGRRIEVSTPNIDAIVAITSTICDLSPYVQLTENVRRLPYGVDPVKKFLFEGKG